MEQELNTLQEAIAHFSNPVNCREYVVARRWPNGVACPHCGSPKVKFSEKHNRWQCSSHHDKRQFTIKTGTIFEDSPLPLGKWLCAMWQVVNCKNGVSSYEVHRPIGVTQKTAWFMDHRIRLALRMGSFEKLSGEVEVDETFIGGLARNMHKGKREFCITGTGGKNKVPVIGFLQRGGHVRSEVIPNRKKNTLQGMVRGQVADGSALYTDALDSYEGLEAAYRHQVVNQAVEYVRGRVHTNGLENFWSLLKRGIKGTYVSVEPFHLGRYLDEQMFRYNNRLDMNDGDRFDLAVRQIVGKRLTYAELTGKVNAQA
jgi:transposase-like protein